MTARAAIAATVTAAVMCSPAAALAAPLPTEIASLSASVTTASAVFTKSSPLEVGATVQNTSNAPLEDVSLVLDLTDEPLSTSAELAAFLDDPSSVDASEIAREPAVEEPAEDEQEAEEDSDGADAGSSDEDSEEPAGVTIAANQSRAFTVTAGDVDLGGDAGVYGVTVSAHTPSGTEVIDVLAATWTGGDLETLSLATLASADGTDTAAQQVIATVADTPASIAADPMLMTNGTLLDGGFYDREVVWLPAGNPDLTSLAHAEDPRLLEFALQRTPTSSLAASLDAPWIAAPAVLDGSTAALAQEQGALAMVALAGTVGLDDAREAVGDAPAAVVETPDGDLPVLLPHQAITEAVATYRPGTPAQWSRVVAETALASQAGVQGALLAPGDEWLRTPSSGDLLTRMSDLPWVEAVDVASLVDEDAPALEVDQVRDADADLESHQVLSLGDQLEPLATLSTITTDPRAAYDGWGDALVNVVALSGRAGPAGREIAYASAMQDTRDVLAGVSIASGSDLNLLAQDGEVPVTVVNDLDWDVTVAVKLTSNSPNLVVEEVTEVDIPAGQSRVAMVGVSAVSSANVELGAQLLNDSGQQIGQSQMFEVRVRADWGTAATLVFTGVLVLLLIAGVIRTIRRGRKDTRTDAVTAPEEAAPEVATSEVEVVDEDAAVDEDVTVGEAREDADASGDGEDCR
ncbi:DUF6049 family protein [Demequina globuliformis]|uniref:DUF6049 family protein n=1 Tax=Demequina globuliformis TaxID=676202 RepID=UPI000786689E|nr:DUF6049 family protein [Demequina globuliformis]